MLLPYIRFKVKLRKEKAGALFGRPAALCKAGPNQRFLRVGSG